LCPCYYGIKFRYNGNDSAVDNIKASAITSNSKILIDYNASPTIRYLFEYGEFKNNFNIYPNSFTLYDYSGNIIDFNGNKFGKFDDDINNYDYVILSHYSQEDVKRMLSLEKWESCTVKTPGSIFKKRNG
jgi:hypothetical protein